MASTSNHSQNGQVTEVLVVTIAHDIRNYLQGILGCAELLLKE